jgi:hypothetical protein
MPSALPPLSLLSVPSIGGGKSSGGNSGGAGDLRALEALHREQLFKLNEQRVEQQVQHREQLAKMDEQRVEQQVQHREQLQKMDELVQELMQQRQHKG